MNSKQGRDAQAGNHRADIDTHAPGKVHAVRYAGPYAGSGRGPYAANRKPIAFIFFGASYLRCSICILDGSFQSCLLGWLQSKQVILHRDVGTSITPRGNSIDTQLNTETFREKSRAKSKGVTPNPHSRKLDQHLGPNV